VFFPSLIQYDKSVPARRKAITRELFLKKRPTPFIERATTRILTFNRPEASNALSTEMLSSMVEAWDPIVYPRSRHPMRILILTLAGGYFFAARP